MKRIALLLSIAIILAFIIPGAGCIDNIKAGDKGNSSPVRNSMIEIFHISDLHIGKDEKRRSAVNRFIDKIQSRFDIISEGNRYLLITGDITDGGSRDEYKAAMDALQRFNGKIFVVPGNHDYGDGGNKYSEKSANAFDDFVKSLGIQKDPSFIKKKEVYKKELTDSNDKNNNVLLIGLNSCNKIGYGDWSEGVIGDDQLKDLKKILANSNPAVPVLVFLHHIPYKEAQWAAIMDLQDREALMNILDGKYDVLAFGHQGFKFKVLENQKKVVIPESNRDMKVYESSRKKKSFILDANNSVDKQSCYHIKIEKSKVTVDIINFKQEGLSKK